MHVMVPCKRTVIISATKIRSMKNHLSEYAITKVGTTSFEFNRTWIKTVLLFWNLFPNQLWSYIDPSFFSCVLVVGSKANKPSLTQMTMFLQLSSFSSIIMHCASSLRWFCPKNVYAAVWKRGHSEPWRQQMGWFSKGSCEMAHLHNKKVSAKAHVVLLKD